MKTFVKAGPDGAHFGDKFRNHNLFCFKLYDKF